MTKITFMGELTSTSEFISRTKSCRHNDAEKISNFTVSAHTVILSEIIKPIKPFFLHLFFFFFVTAGSCFVAKALLVICM